ncbi:malate synthase G [Flaviflagellibacter deserti]|uniref:Malate synthase G n=1 Tax=Flaviflagellibacter deserti TaxID=2267266 RepID=A0ABV9YZ70_9HYPH
METFAELKPDASARITVDPLLAAFIENEVIPGTGVDPGRFWSGLDALIAEFEPRNRALLRERDRLQAEIDAWHVARRGEAFDLAAYRRFLEKIGYLGSEPPHFEVDVQGVDAEVAKLNGPQLVVPVTSARYALNAANARWGSLYDALYGTDALLPKADSAGHELDTSRATLVIDHVKGLLDRWIPLADGSHSDVVSYRIAGGALECRLSNGEARGLLDAAAFVGHRGPEERPEHVYIKHHGLHIDLAFDPDTPSGRLDPAGMSDVVLEAALTTIVDFEDSVATVDVQDKIPAYRDWLGLMKGTLRAAVRKGGGEIERRLADDRSMIGTDGRETSLPGRSLLLVRNVGQHVKTDMVLTKDGDPVSEAFIDAAVTTLIGLHDLRGEHRGLNSRAGSIYVVKPKMHGADEVQLAVDLFARLEEIYGLSSNTIKIGIMDEERRMSANLRAALNVARHRVFFINTGFLDRTGDEIHTAMEAGPVVPKTTMKSQPWLRAYEERNVVTGLNAGLDRKGQIGKGMWTATDRMADMIAQKGAQLRAGASTAWVPSPTAAVLHAIHYHGIDVRDVQSGLRSAPLPPVTELLTPSLADPDRLTEAVVRSELDNNVQSLLGYVVRWIDQGVGCSKVPDINGIDLMEDRATLRISSQHIANWLLHGVISAAQVDESLRRMAVLVDRQNAEDTAYIPMSPGFDGIAFRTARDLIFDARTQPNGYTEFLLAAGRAGRKKLG